MSVDGVPYELEADKSDPLFIACESTADFRVHAPTNGASAEPQSVKWCAHTSEHARSVGDVDSCAPSARSRAWIISWRTVRATARSLCIEESP